MKGTEQQATQAEIARVRSEEIARVLAEYEEVDIIRNRWRKPYTLVLDAGVAVILGRGEKHANNHKEPRRNGEILQ